MLIADERYTNCFLIIEHKTQIIEKGNNNKDFNLEIRSFLYQNSGVLIIIQQLFLYLVS